MGFSQKIDFPGGVGTLGVAYTPSSGTVTLATGTATAFLAGVTPSPSAPLRFTLSRAADPAVCTHYQCTGVSGDTLTGVTVLSGTDQAFSSGDTIFSSIYAEDFADIATATVTVTAGTGLSGGGAIALGGSATVSVATGTANTLAGYGNTGTFSGVAIGAGLSLSGGTLSATGGGGSGTVTSVGLSLPGIFSVSGSPVTTSGTLAGSLATQPANAIFAGPTTGVAAAPTFRSLVAADFPAGVVANGALANSTITISGHTVFLGGSVSLSAADVGLGSVTNDAQTKAAVVPNAAPSAGQVLVGNAGGTAYAAQSISGSGATITLGATGVLAISAIANASLANSTVTISGHAVSLGGSVSLAAADVGLGSVTNAAQTLASVVPNAAPSAGQVLAGNAGGTAYAPVTVSGDASMASTGAVTVSKIGGKSVTLGGALTTSGAFGLTLTLTALTSLTLPTSGTVATTASTFPAGQITGLAASATTDTTNASNIASGTLAAARLPAAAVQTNQANTYTAGPQYLSAGALETVLFDNGNSGAAKTIAWDNGNNQKVTITAAATLTFTAPTNPGKFTLLIQQDATGHAYTLPAIKWPGGVAPTTSSAANAIDVVTVLWTGSVYLGQAATNFS